MTLGWLLWAVEGGMSERSRARQREISVCMFAAQSGQWHLYTEGDGPVCHPQLVLLVHEWIDAVAQRGIETVSEEL